MCIYIYDCNKILNFYSTIFFGNFTFVETKLFQKSKKVNIAPEWGAEKLLRKEIILKWRKKEKAITFLLAETYAY